jgi:hypothetical protein
MTQSSLRRYPQMISANSEWQVIAFGQAVV